MSALPNVEPTARVMSGLLRGYPNVAIFASSRRGLGIAGEAIYLEESRT